MSEKKVFHVGVIGTGMISGIYLDTLTKRFEITQVDAVADLDVEKARRTAEKYGIHLISVSDRITVKELSHIAQSARNTYTEYCWSLQKMAAERHSFNDLLTYTERVYQISGCLLRRYIRLSGFFAGPITMLRNPPAGSGLPRTSSCA